MSHSNYIILKLGIHIQFHLRQKVRSLSVVFAIKSAWIHTHVIHWFLLSLCGHARRILCAFMSFIATVPVTIQNKVALWGLCVSAYFAVSPSKIHQYTSSIITNYIKPQTAFPQLHCPQSCHSYYCFSLGQERFILIFVTIPQWPPGCRRNWTASPASQILHCFASC